MPSSTNDARELVLRTLRERGRLDAASLVELLHQTFALSEEEAGEVIWDLIDAHSVKVNDEAALEVEDVLTA